MHHIQRALPPLKSFVPLYELHPPPRFLEEVAEMVDRADLGVVPQEHLVQPTVRDWTQRTREDG